MLFTFNRFWKGLFTITGAWILYAFLGYEFTVVTLLSLLLISQIDPSKHLL